MITVPDEICVALMSPERYIQARVTLFVDENPIDITEDIISFDTLETKTSTTASPYGTITYNELHIELDNLSRNYTLTNNESPYFQKLKAKMKVIVEYLVYPDLADLSRSYTISGGTFYTDTWKGDVGENTATVDCYDIVQLYGQSPLKAFKLQKNISAARAFEFLFKLYNIPTNLYKIDKKLTVSLDFFRPVGDTLTECLESLALACCADVYADRSGRIIVESIVRKKTSSLEIDGEVIYNVKAPATSREAYAYISMSYFESTERQQSLLYENKEITIPKGQTTLSGLLSQKGSLVGVSCVSVIGEKVSIIGRSYTDNTIDVTLNNQSDSEQQIEIRIYGESLQINQGTLTRECDPEASSNNLQISLEQCISIHEAQKNINLLQQLFGRGTVQQEIEIRALPFLELGDKVTVHSPESRLNQEFYVSEISQVFDGALTGTLKLSAAEYKPAAYTWIAPGLYIKRKEEDE